MSINNGFEVFISLLYVACEKLDPLPLNPVNEDNGIRNQILITLFFECLEPK